MMPITQGTIQIIDSIRRKLDIEEENATSATEIIDGELLAYYLTLINEKLEEISSSSQKGHTVMQGVEKTDDIKTLKLENEWKSREMSQAHEKEKSRLKEELQSLMGAEQLLKEKVERLEGELRQARERLQTSEKQDKELYSKTHQLAFRSLGQIGQEPPKDAPTDHQILASLSERVVSSLETHISTLKKDSEGKTSEVTRLQKEIEALKTSEASVEPKGFKLEAVIKLATVCKRICSPGEAAETSPAEDLELLALATESAVNQLIGEQLSQKEVAVNHQTQLRESAERVDELQKRVEEQDKLLSDHKTGMETLLSEVQSLCGMANIEVDFKPVAQKALNNPGVLAPLVKSVCETVLQLNTSNSKEKEQVEQKISVIHNLLEPQQGSVNSARKNIDDRLEFIQTAVSQLTKSQTENQDAKKDKTLSNQQSPDLIAHADGMVYGLAIIEEIAKLLPNFNIDQDQLRKADRTTVDSKIIEIIQALNEMSQAHEKEKSRLKEELQKLKGAEQLLKEQVQKLEGELRQARERLQTSESAVDRLIGEQLSQKEVAVNHQTQLRESAERVDELQKRVEEQDKLLSDHKTGMETLLSEVQSLCGMANIEVDFKPVAQKALNNPGVLAPLVKSASETVLQLKTSNSKEKEQVEQRLSSSDDQSPNSNAQQLKELMQLIELHSKRIEGDEHFSGSHQDRLNNLIGSLEQRYQEYLKSTFEKIYSSSVFFCRGLIGVVEWVEHEELRYRLSNFLEDLLSSIVKSRSTERRHIVSLSEADQNSSTKSTHWSNIEHAFFAQANELGS